MPDIRLTSGDSVLFQGPGVLETTDKGVRIRFEGKDFRQTWVIAEGSLEIRSETELDVRMRLSAQEICPVIIESPWGKIRSEAAVHGLIIEETQAEVVYELEGDRHHFLLEWTKE